MNEADVDKLLQAALTRYAYDALRPLDQGYVSYVQAATNLAIPAANPYRGDSDFGNEWHRGQVYALLDEMDGAEWPEFPGLVDA